MNDTDYWAYEVCNKVCSYLFATRELAEKFILDSGATTATGLQVIERPVYGSHPPSPDKEQAGEIDKERLREYAKDIRIVQSQVDIWNKDNMSRCHGQKVLLGAVADELEKISSHPPSPCRECENCDWRDLPKLRAEIKRYREALQEIANTIPDFKNQAEIAKTALETGKEGA